MLPQNWYKTSLKPQKVLIRDNPTTSSQIPIRRPNHPPKPQLTSILKLIKLLLYGFWSTKGHRKTHVVSKYTLCSNSSLSLFSSHGSSQTANRATPPLWLHMANTTVLVTLRLSPTTLPTISVSPTSTGCKSRIATLIPHLDHRDRHLYFPIIEPTNHRLIYPNLQPTVRLPIPSPIMVCSSRTVPISHGPTCRGSCVPPSLHSIHDHPRNHPLPSSTEQGGTRSPPPHPMGTAIPERTRPGPTL